MTKNTKDLVPRMLQTIWEQQRLINTELGKLIAAQESLTAELRLTNAGVAAMDTSYRT